MPHDYNAPRRSNDSPIAKARQAKGMTQTQLADAIGANQRQVSDWELGRLAISAATIKRIAAVLDMDVSELLDFASEKQGHSIIATARRKKGMTQIEFAKAISVSQTLISKLETGLYPISPEVQRRISEVLDIPIDSLAPHEAAPDGEKG